MNNPPQLPDDFKHAIHLFYDKNGRSKRGFWKLLSETRHGIKHGDKADFDKLTAIE